jgi:anti-anti-sigma regulatory factor
MPFNIALESGPQNEVIFISGSIDENSNFEGVKPKSLLPLHIDLRGVKHINSLGLRNWVQWMKTLLQHKSGIFLRNCPAICVNQINILEGFLPMNAIVESIEVPFICETCGSQSTYNAARGKDFIEYTQERPERVMMQMVLPCTKCNAPSEADIIPSRYFKFLKRSAPKS